MSSLRWFILALLGSSLLVSQWAAAATYSVCNDEIEVYPWYLHDGAGLNSVLLNMAGERAGVSFKVVRMPWAECLRQIEQGKLAGAFAASYSESRAAFAVYPMRGGVVDESRQLMTDDYVLYRRKGSALTWDGTTIGNLDGLVGVQPGYSIAEDLKLMGIATDERHASAAEALQRLAKGELAAAAVLAYQGIEQMRQAEIAGSIEAVSAPLKRKPYFLIFNKSFYKANRQQIESLWTAIAVARKSPKYRAIESAVSER
jgi:polar amino acid transport system substrate-binding protein